VTLVIAGDAGESKELGSRRAKQFLLTQKKIGRDEGLRLEMRNKRCVKKEREPKGVIEEGKSLRRSEVGIHALLYKGEGTPSTEGLTGCSTGGHQLR